MGGCGELQLERSWGVNKCLLNEGILSPFNKHLLQVSLASSAKPKGSKAGGPEGGVWEEGPLSCRACQKHHDDPDPVG